MHEELRRERGDGEVEAAQPEARQAENNADGGGRQPGEHKAREQGQARHAQQEIVAGEGAHGHEGGTAERHLAGIAGQEVEPQRRQADGQERRQDRVEQVVGVDERHGQGENQQQDSGRQIAAEARQAGRRSRTL